MTENELKLFWQINNDLWPIMKKYLSMNPKTLTDEQMKDLICTIETIYLQYRDTVAGDYAGYVCQAVTGTIEKLRKADKEVEQFEQEAFFL